MCSVTQQEQTRKMSNAFSKFLFREKENMLLFCQNQSPWQPEPLDSEWPFRSSKQMYIHFVQLFGVALPINEELK